MCSSRSFFSGSYFRVILVVFLALSVRNASADYDYWFGGTSDWSTASNWSSGHAPVNGDVVWFYNQTPDMQVTLSQPSNPLGVLYFTGNGNGYTLGATGSTNSLVFPDYNGIWVQSSLSGNNEGETINAPIEAQSRFFIGNWSPTNPEPSISGVAGSNNPLTLNGTLTGDNGANVFFMGAGNVQVNGNIVGTNGYNVYEDSMATVTMAGTNNYTGATMVGGTMVLDYTTNNTNKLSTSSLNLGWGSNNSGNGGHLVLEGNNNANTVQTTGDLYIRNGANSITVNGGSGPGVTATLNIGNINYYGTGATVDFSTNANGVITTTATNNNNNGSINIIGQYATFDETYWAQAGTATGSSQTGGTSVQITGLTMDDGDTFDNNLGNFTVDAGGETLAGFNEGANTIRFTAGGTLDLDGGVLSTVYGGIMVTKDVTADTEVADGGIDDNSQHGGLAIYNYGTGTLTISAIMGNANFSKSGSGDVVISGDNSDIVNQQIVINQGKLVMGSATALGFGNNLQMGDATATLDLNGNSVTLGSLNSNNDYLPGNQAAAAGLNSNIVNSAAGTLSRITIAGNGTSNDTNVQPNNLYGDTNLGQYTGGINEVNGSIISLDIEQGSDTSQVQFLLGTAYQQVGDQSGANVNSTTQVNGATIEFTGSLIVGAGANLGLTGYGDVQTMGVFDLDGNFSVVGEQAALLGTTYLTGTGAMTPGQSAGADALAVNPIGSIADVFDGHFGTDSATAQLTLTTGGTGNLTFTNTVYNDGVETTGSGSLTMPGLATNARLTIAGQSTVTVNGTGGVETGNNVLTLTDSTLVIAPSGSGADVVVTGGADGSQIGIYGGSSIILDKDQNNSLTYEFGSATSNFNIYQTNYASTLLIGSAQGLAALGTTDKFILLNNGINSNGTGIINQSTDIVSPDIMGQNDSAGSPLDATFLTYVGTGAATDGGFTAYTFTGDNTNNLNNATQTSVELINNAQTLSNTVAVYGLEIDKGGSLAITNGATLLLGDNGAAGTNMGGLILNGASITGSVALDRTSYIYTDLDNGTISSLTNNGQALVKTGPGTLFVTNYNFGGGIVDINGGAIDLGNLANLGTTGTEIALQGGVLQGYGTYNARLADTGNGVIFVGSNDYSNALSGGFSAQGSSSTPGGNNLTVTLTDGNGSTNLVWGAGGTANFLQEGSVLDFGSNTANGQVIFTDNLNLGFVVDGDAGGLGTISRVIKVTANAADAGKDPFDPSVTDSASMTGVISSSNPYASLAKTGTGTLYLLGNNTYTGPTTIDEGMLAIKADSGLGIAPTAAYALNTTPKIAGAAITPGAVEINGGAALGIFGGDVVLNSNRQILLGSGATGATPSIINVQGSDANGYSDLQFGGIIADYAGEVGSLEKAGGGTFEYSGTAYNTGADSVVAGTFSVVADGDINSVSGITINNQSTNPNATATFNYASTSVGLTQTVAYGAGGGNFAYNSSFAYAGASSLTVGAKDIVSGAGNLGNTAVTIARGGTLLPGNITGKTAATGLLTLGNVTLMGGGNYNFLLVDVIDYSSVQANSVDLTNLLAGTPFNINLETLAGNVPGAPIGFDPTSAYSFTLFQTGAGGITALTQAQLDADFAIYATANNGATGFDSVPGNWEVVESSDDSTLSLTYNGEAVPEPSTWAMLIGGLGLLLFVRRLRRRLM